MTGTAVPAASAAARLQFAELRREPAQLLIFVTVPLFSLMFLSITRDARDEAAVVNAVIAPALIALWFLALDLGGGIVSVERQQGTLELMFATPAPLAAVVLGRVLSVLGLGGLTLVESVLVARLAFGISLRIEHPGLMVVTLVATLFAMAGACAALAGLFVLSRSVLLFQNSMTSPFYILGGVMVPLALLPGWVQPVGRLVFLSWSADLLRDCARAAPVTHALPRLGAVVLLGTVTLLGGLYMIGRVVDRVRRTGTATFA